MYPQTRISRIRRSESLRRLARECRLDPQQLIYPVFVVDGEGRREAIDTMPGISRLSIDLLRKRLPELRSTALLIFGVPDRGERDDTGSAACRDDGLVARAVRAVKTDRPDLAVLTDVCLCGYTSHGHCGVLADGGSLDQDATLGHIAAMSVAHARAGADMVAPSGMIDGQVQAIRRALDDEGLTGCAVMSYASKFASSFYGPFRDAADSAPGHGDRRGHQLPPSNRREALREALADQDEGADWLMVKPAMPYLDVIHDLRANTPLPIAAYQVSGEYAMIRFAARSGALDEKQAALESLLSIRRAGADAIITYFAEEAAGWLSP